MPPKPTRTALRPAAGTLFSAFTFFCIVTSLLPTASRAQVGRPDGLYYKSWGIVIGIDDYLIAPKLQGSVSEGKAVAEAFRKLGFEEVIELYDKDAGFRRLNSFLSDFLPRKVGRQDRLVLFFSGHAGTTKDRDDKEIGYLVPWDAQRDNVNKVVTFDQLKDFAKRVSSKHNVFIINAGVSGWDATPPQQLSLEGRLTPEEETDKRAVQILTAGAAGEKVTSREGRSLFVLSVIDGLKGEADENKNGWLLASELAGYVKRVVETGSSGRQHPQFARLDGDGDLIFIEGKKHQYRIRQPKTDAERVTAAKEEYEEAFALLQRQRPAQEAVDILDRALGHNPAYGDAYVLKSYILLEHLQNPDAALPVAEQAVKYAAQNPDSYFTLGLVQQRKGRLAEAEQSFLQALRVNPKYADVHLTLADLYAFDLKDHAKAVDAYKKYLEAGGTDPRAMSYVEQAGAGQK